MFLAAIVLKTLHAIQEADDRPRHGKGATNEDGLSHFRIPTSPVSTADLRAP